ncbi:MAG: hypothetical protein IKE43_00365 [Coriobacteriales bacterium]|nr:hypothetical protein [Coriobacteriales bacterium]
MDVSAELNYRLIRKAVKTNPALLDKPEAIQDLSRQMLRSPERYAQDAEDKALIELEKAVSLGSREIDDELDAFYEAAEGMKPYVASDLPRLKQGLQKALELDPHCYDAQILLSLVETVSLDHAIQKLDNLIPEAKEWCMARSEAIDEPTEDPFDAVCLRPWLRLEAKIIDLLIQGACYREALTRSIAMLNRAPQDAQGIRYMTSLILARLEDEDGLNTLDARFDHTGNAWMHIARSILLYKLGRIPAARRATLGLANLCPGLAFYLVNPTYTEPYLPDRPYFTPGTSQESLLASYEAEFLIADTPEYIAWALSLEGFKNAAETFHEPS